MNLTWEQLGDGVFRARLPFLDVTVGVVHGVRGTLLIDSGTTQAEAWAIAQDVRDLTGASVSHIVLTHDHFDHVLGSAGFTGAAIYAAPGTAHTMRHDPAVLRADAIAYGADPGAVDRALEALPVPTHQIHDAVLDLGVGPADRTVSISHPGPGHTRNDLIVLVPGADNAVVFCGDLVEQSGDPDIGPDAVPAAWPDTLDRVLAVGGPDARYVPGHGAVVDAQFVRDQQRWLRDRV